MSEWICHRFPSSLTHRKWQEKSISILYRLLNRWKKGLHKHTRVGEWTDRHCLDDTGEFLLPWNDNGKCRRHKQGAKLFIDRNNNNTLNTCTKPNNNRSVDNSLIPSVESKSQENKFIYVCTHSCSWTAHRNVKLINEQNRRKNNIEKAIKPQS